MYQIDLILIYIYVEHTQEEGIYIGKGLMLTIIKVKSAFASQL